MMEETLSRTKYESLSKQLEELIEHFRLIEIMVSDFQPQSQVAFNQQINSVIENLQEIQNIKLDLPDIQIPFDLIEFIDKDLTTEIYMKDNMDKCIFKNEESKKRVETFQKFKTLLTSEISNIYPTDITKYNILRSEDTTFEI